jgi:RNA polymerase sigma-70 factor, ECF subfamily
MIFNIKGRKSVKTDEIILKEFISTGDIDLLGDLYSRYMHLVYGVCLKYFKNSEEAKDAVMFIFEKLMIEIPRHKIENFKNWLYMVVKNYCLMEIRTKRSQDVKLDEWKKETIFFMENDHLLHPIDKEDGDMERALYDCIERLKDDQKQCIKQFYFENKCYNEIAACLGLDENKVKSYLQNGKRNLKICLEGKK